MADDTAIEDFDAWLTGKSPGMNDDTAGFIPKPFTHNDKAAANATSTAEAIDKFHGQVQGFKDGIVNTLFSAGQTASLGLMDDALVATGTASRAGMEIQKDEASEHPIPALLGSLGGAAIPIGAPAKIAQAFAYPARSIATGTGFGGYLTRLAQQGAAGAAESAMYAFNEGQHSLGAVATEAATGAIFGTGGQAVFGEFVPLAIRQLSPHAASNTVTDALVSSGKREGEFSVDWWRQQGEKIAQSNTGILNLPNSSNVQHQAIERVTQFIAEAKLPMQVKGQGGGTVQDWNKVTRAIDRVQEIQLDARKQVDDAITSVATPQPSTARRNATRDQQLAGPRQVYDELFNTRVEGEAGLRQFNGRQINNDFTKRLSTNLDTVSLPDEAIGRNQTILNRTYNLLSERGQTPNAYQVKKDQVIEPKDPKERVILGDVSLKSLLNARKQIAREYTPGTTIDGTTVDREDARFAAAIVKSLDEMIDARTNNAYGKAKTGITEVMSASDARESGYQVFQTRATEMTDTGESIGEWMKNPARSPAELDEFRRGFSGALHDATQADTSLGTLSALFGKPDKPFEMKQHSYELVSDVLGADAADLLKETLSGTIPRQRMLATLEGVLQKKLDNPEKGVQLERDGDSLILSNAFTNPDAGFDTVSFKAALYRQLFQPTARQGIAGIELLTDQGPDANKRLQAYLDQFENPRTVPVGGQVGLVAGTQARSAEHEVGRRLEQAGEAIPSIYDMLGIGEEE